MATPIHSLDVTIQFNHECTRMNTNSDEAEVGFLWNLNATMHKIFNAKTLGVTEDSPSGIHPIANLTN